MKPKEFGWKEDQQVTVKNPTNEDFKFKVHNKEYVVPKGQTAKMPGYIAWLYVYKLASKMAIANDDFIHWNEENFRTKYYDQIVVGTDALVQTVTTESEPEVETFDDVDEDNQTDTEPASDLPKVKPMRRKKVAKKSS